MHRHSHKSPRIQITKDITLSIQESNTERCTNYARYNSKIKSIVNMITCPNRSFYIFLLIQLAILTPVKIRDLGKIVNHFLSDYCTNISLAQQSNLLPIRTPFPVDHTYRNILLFLLFFYTHNIVVLKKENPISLTFF
jgi:hypothetical protein